MAIVDVLNVDAEKVSQIELNSNIFEAPIKKYILHDVVKMQLACRRAGTATVKNRSDVRGSTRKLYRQKGTGRARRGDIKSPLLRGGGVVFGPNNRKYAYKLPKKVVKLALKMALSSKLKEGQLVLLNQFTLDEIKTKKFLEVIKKLNIKNSLIVIDKEDKNLELSSKNVQGFKVLRNEGLNVYDILKYENLILLEATINIIEGRLVWLCTIYFEVL